MAPRNNEHRTSVGDIARLLAEGKTVATSSVSLKSSAQGVLQPEVTIGEGLSQTELNKMVRQAKAAYTALAKTKHSLRPSR